MENNVENIRTLLNSISKAVIVMHRGPDGDAMGSSHGWSRLLRAAGIETTVVAPDAPPRFLQWLPDAGETLIFENRPDEVKAALAACDASDGQTASIPRRPLASTRDWSPIPAHFATLL
ncbi:MAG: hypothetical protein LC670_05765 [Flavobacteriales bacterium]|nr:hypothetical protein [Flavobacteriales bacterium]